MATKLKRYVIQANDSIHQIARRELGSADQWWVLVRQNDLAFPYIDPTGPSSVARVLGVGDTILIPGNANDPTIRRSSSNLSVGYGEQYDLLLGADLLLTAAGDLEPSAGSGDYSLQVGLLNLVQSLQRRLLTRKGELPYHPEYGSNIFRHIGQPLDALRLAAIRHEVRQTLLDDPRVTSIKNMTISVDFDHVHLVVIATIIGQNEEVPLNLVLNQKAA